MKAIVFEEYGPPDVLQLKEVPAPIPEDDEVLIKIYASVVTTLDCDTRRGVPFFSRLFTGLMKPSTIILGFEIAGEIESVGTDVTRFQKSDQVYGATTTSLGGHAQYMCLSEEGAVVIKSPELSFEEAVAIVEGGLTALPFLRDKAIIKSGQAVLIIGASGSIGTAAVQIAKYFEADVTGVCSTPNIELVKSLGADKIIDYTIEDFSKSNQTYDIIFDPAGNSSYSRCKGSLKKGGVYLTAAASPAIIPQMLWTSLIGSKKAMIAFTGLRASSEKAKDLVLLNELCESGHLRPVIDRVYPLEETAEAHRYVETGHKKGNVVITMAHNGEA